MEQCTLLAGLVLAASLASLAPAQQYQLVPNLVFDAALNLQLDLYLPLAATPPYPVVVWVHGGAWSGGTRAAAGQASQLCPRGFAVAGVDYRLTGVARWPAQIHDCKGAIRWLRARAAQYGLDPDRFGVWGSSAGGHLVACLGTMGDVGAVRIGNVSLDLEGTTGGNLTHSSRVQAVADWFGPTEFVRMSEFPSGIPHDAANSPESVLIGGPIQDNPDRCATANPVTFLSPDDPPFVIMHGTDDTTVPFQQSEILERAARLGTGLDVTWFPVQGNGHGGPGFNANIQLVYDLFDRRLRDLPAVNVSVVASDPAASESGDPGAYTISRTGSTAAALVVRVWAGSRAENGVDCAPLPALVTIPAGLASVTLPLAPLQDLLVEGAEDVVLTVCPSPDYRVDVTRARAAVTIADDEVAGGLPVVTVTAADARASEAGTDPGTLVVSRTGSTAASLTVSYVLGGSAVHGVDYAALPLTVTIPVGQPSASVTIVPIDDPALESGEFATLRLVPDVSYAVGAPDEAGVVIADNDRVAARPIVSVILTDVGADESGADRAVFTLTRTGATTAALVVPFTVSGRAQPGPDFTLSAASPATIPAGAMWTRITLTGLPDVLLEGEESVVLSAAPGAAWHLASQPAVELTLRDDDAAAPVFAARLHLGPIARGGALLATTLGAPGAATVTWLAGDPGFLPVSGGGAFLLDPAQATPIAVQVLDASGAVVLALPVPSDHNLQGVVVRCQAMTVQVAPVALGFSDAVARRID